PIDVSKVKNLDGLFYASVDFKSTGLVEAGSRTIAIVGIADTLSDAEVLAEKEVSSISGPLFHRTDIGTDEIVQKRVDHMNSLR
ncbi:MAG: phosphoribosylglycinamide synthetase C domain-containing protein, partial [Candidatus Marinimicrobia bacterium]|nr:phosphoribosylglycinamide synthetase C domain-containing protein [Candidatus Neomarinimicrobiota bacterium]